MIDIICQASLLLPADTLNKTKRNKIRPVNALVLTGRFCFIQRFPRILGQFDEDFAHGDTVHAEISYYIIGQCGVESERLPDEFKCDIVSHLRFVFFDCDTVSHLRKGK